MSNQRLREAVQQALEAMEAAHDESLDENHFECRQILLAQIKSLRETLAQPDDKVPVIKAEMYMALTDAMGYQEERDGSNWSPEEWAAHLYESYQSKQDDKTQPVGELEVFTGCDRLTTFRKLPEGKHLLYAAPQPPANQGTELSDEQIDDYLNQPVPGGSIVRDWFSFPRGLQNVRNVVRIIVTADRAARGDAA